MPQVTGAVQENPTKRSGRLKFKSLRRAVDSDDDELSSDKDKVGSVDGPCRMGVRLLLSS